MIANSINLKFELLFIFKVIWLIIISWFYFMLIGAKPNRMSLICPSTDKHEREYNSIRTISQVNIKEHWRD